MRKFLSILMVLALVTALFVSCSQDNVGSVVGEDLVSVSFATGGSSRALTVSREVFDEYDYIWCYTAVKADNSGMTQGETRVGELIKEAYVWGDDHTKTGLTGAEISGLSQGLWDFTLRAYVPIYEGSVITGKSDVRAWFGSVTNQPVRKGEANVVNVTVSAVIDPDNKGTITFEEVVVRKLNDENVTAPAIWTGDKDLVLGVQARTLAGEAVADAFVSYFKGSGHTKENIPAPKFELAAGSYLVTFKAYEGEFDAPTFTYAEETIAVNVYSGLKTIIGGYISELSSYVVFGEPVANAVIEASTPSVIEVTPQSAPISFVTDSTQSTSYKAASIPAVSVVNIKETVEAAIPEGSTLTDLALSLNVADKGSTDAAEKTTKNFEISLDAVVTTTDAAGLVSVESKDITGGIEQFMTVQLYIGKELADLKVYHHDDEVKESGEQELGAEYYEYDKTSAGDGILTLHVNHFSPFSVEYSKKVAVARLIKADGTGSDFYTLQEAVDAAKGDTVKLLKDIDLSAQIVVTEELTLDLNGQKLYNTNDLWVGDSWSLISVRAGGDLTITGNGTLDPKENDCYAIDVQDGAKLDVKNGTFFGNITVIYAYDGFVTVEGGTFDLYQLSDKATDKYRFMLNCLDEARAAGDAWFTVTGGTFNSFNPADNASEGPHTDYVPANYSVEVDGSLYTVVPYEGDGVVVNMTSVPRTYYTLVGGKLADLDGELIPEQDLPAKTDELVLLNSSLANSVDVSIDNFNAGYTWTAIHSETEPDYGKQYFEGGWGTRIEPYLIGSLDQLVNMDSTPESLTADTELYYALIEDIDAKAHDSEVDWAHGFYYNDPTYYHVNMRNHSLTIGNNYLFGYAVKLEMCNGSIVFDGAASVVDYACYQNVSSYEMYFHDLTLSGTVETSNAHYGLLVSYAFGISSGSAAFNASNIVNNVSIFNNNSTAYTGGLFGYVQGTAVSSSVTDCTFNGSIVSAYAGGFLNPCSFPNGDVSKVTSTGNILNGSLLASTTAIAFGATTTNLQKTVSLGDSASIVVIPESTDLISVDGDDQVILSRKDNVATYRVAIVFSVHSTVDGKGGYPRYITVDIDQFAEETTATGIYKYEIQQSETDESEGKTVVTDAGSYKIWLDGETYYVYCPDYEIDKTPLNKTRATIWAYGYDADSKMIAYQKIIYTF